MSKVRETGDREVDFDLQTLRQICRVLRRSGGVGDRAVWERLLPHVQYAAGLCSSLADRRRNWRDESVSFDSLSEAFFRLAAAHIHDGGTEAEANKRKEDSLAAVEGLLRRVVLAADE
jgi:hypothetical protein